MIKKNEISVIIITLIIGVILLLNILGYMNSRIVGPLVMVLISIINTIKGYCKSQDGNEKSESRSDFKIAIITFVFAIVLSLSNLGMF